MKSKTKIRAINLPVPQNRDDAAAAIRRIGDANRDIARIEADMNDRLAAIKQECETRAQPMRNQVAADTEGLKVWAEANRDVLTNGGKVKFADMGTGKINWRLRPAKVSIRKVEDVIDELKRLGLQKFLRVKEEVNKEAMLEAPDEARGVAGVSIGSAGEDFIVEPFEAEIARATT